MSRNDLDPVPVRVADEVDAHGGVLEADAAHFLVLGVGGLVVSGLQGQVELALPQIVLLGVVPQPGQLQAEIRLSVSQEDEDKAAVLRLFPADWGEAQGGSRPRASL